MLQTPCGTIHFSIKKSNTDFSKYIMSKALRFRLGEDGNLYGSISASSGEFYIAPEIL
jgi:hypothetical protein